MKADEAIESLSMGFLPATGLAGKTGDLVQAACLAAPPRTLAEALKDLLQRGAGWVARYRQGAAALHSAYPGIEVSDRLASAV